MSEKMKTFPLLSAVIATNVGSGTVIKPGGVKRTYQAVGTTSSGAGSATIKIWVSNDNSGFVLLGTLTLVLATTITDGTNSDGIVSDAAWKYVKAEVSAISGTDASVNCTLGAE